MLSAADLAMNQQVQHVVALSADLQTRLSLVQLRSLEELRRLQLPEEVLLRHRLLWSRLQLVQDEAFEQLLVRYANLDGLVRWAMLQIPVLDEGDVLCAAHATGTTGVRVGRPPESNGICGQVVFERPVGEQWQNLVGSSNSSSSAPLGPKIVSSWLTRGAFLGTATRREIGLMRGSK